MKVKIQFILFILFGTGCYGSSSMYNADRLFAESGGSLNTCLDSQNQGFQKNNILFVIDKTSSNKKSDPEGETRTKGIQNFIKQHMHLGLHYGLIYFSKKPETLIQDDGTPVFTSDAGQVIQALEKLQTLPDKGKEDYPAILSFIQETIEYDMEINQAPVVDYHIFYVSDGSNSNSQIKDENYFLQGMSAWGQQTHVTIHSVYYGDYKNRKSTLLQKTQKGFGLLVQTYLLVQAGLMRTSSSSDEESEEEVDKNTDDVVLLQNIAEKGQGEFIDFNEQSSIPFQSKPSWSSQHLVVYNLNSAICFDGRMGTDSDSDGLCDHDEEKMEGFSSKNRFSFNDGYGDYFHWFSLNRQNSLPSCLNRTDKDQDLLTQCEENYLNSLFPVEEGVFALKNNHPDSDGDSIIDGIEVLMYLSRNPRAALESYNLNESSLPGEITDLDKILKNLNPFERESEQSFTNDAILVPIQGDQQGCYNVEKSMLSLYPTQPVNKSDTLSNLQHQAGENVVFIYSIKQRESSKERVYKYTFKKMKNADSFSPLSAHNNRFQAKTFSTAYQK